jgi:acetoin utilization deacetylase AcuC-like enzyme
MKIFSHPMFLDESVVHAIDRPSRISVIDYLDYIEARDGFKYLGLFHTDEYINKIKSSCKILLDDDFTIIDGETHINRYSFDIASLAVGASVQAAESAKTGNDAFAIVRPPGHHAHSDYSHGFCLFNNMAIATEHLIQMNYGNEKILIVDLDLHHGDGTEEYALGRKDVFYFSMHQDGLFPETGYENDSNIVNIPIEPETSQAYYEALMQKNLEIILKEFRPTLVGISAGFDSFETDYDEFVGNKLNLKPSVYSKLLDMIEPIPFYAILEGGYNSESVKQGVQEFISWEERN